MAGDTSHPDKIGAKRSAGMSPIRCAMCHNKRPRAGAGLRHVDGLRRWCCRACKAKR